MLLKKKILDLLLSQAEHAEKAAEVFLTVAHNKDYWENGSRELKSIETEADQLIHAITDEAEAVFILPFDKEDIEELTVLLDDFIDNLEETGNRIFIYNFPAPTETLKSFSGLLLEDAKFLHTCVQLICEGKLGSPAFLAACNHIHDIEHQGDALHRQALSDMMSGQKKDILEIVNWKEIYQTLEDTLDRGNELASVFLRLRLKYAG